MDEVKETVEKTLREIRELIEQVREKAEELYEFIDRKGLADSVREDFPYFVFVSSLAKRWFLGRESFWVVVCKKGKPKFGCDGCFTYGNVLFIHDDGLGEEAFSKLVEAADRLSKECGEILVFRGIGK